MIHFFGENLRVIVEKGSVFMSLPCVSRVMLSASRTLPHLPFLTADEMGIVVPIPQNRNLETHKPLSLGRHCLSVVDLN